MSGVLIKYFDGAYNAKEDFTYYSDYASDYCNPSLFAQDAFTAPRYDLLLELNAFALDGNARFVNDDTPSNTQIAFRSEDISDANGDFPAPYIILSFTANTGETYRARGLTLEFDVTKNVYATEVRIAWRRNNVTVEEKTFYPDAPVYYCERDEESNYDEIVFMFVSLNLPFTSLRLNSVDHGKSVTLDGSRLRNASIIQEINPVSLELPINTFDADIETDGDIGISENDALEIYFNDKLLGLEFIRTFKRKAGNVWRISAEDYIGMMSDTTFNGGQYEDESAVSILEAIFETADVPYEIDASFDTATVTGTIEPTSCRDALMQVCFAIGAVADTTWRKVVAVFPLDETIPANALPESRIMIEQDENDSKKISEVEIEVPTFVKTNNEQTIFTAYRADDGKTFAVKLTEPMYGFHATPGLEWMVDIDADRTNAYTVVFTTDWTGSIADSVDIIGKKYDVQRMLYRKANASAKKQNVISINDAGLVSVSNIDDVLDRCYNYYMGSRELRTKIIEGRHGAGNSVTYDEPTHVGDVIKIPTKFSEDFVGRIVRQSYGLNGGILVKDSVVREI